MSLIKCCFLFLIIIPVLAFSQDSLLLNTLPLKEGKVTYEKVIPIDGVAKNDIYTRAKAWAITAFVSQKDALQIDDKEAGMLAYKTFTDIQYTITANGYPATNTRQFWYNVQILIKDNKAKVIINEMVIKEILDAKLAALVPNNLPNYTLEQYSNLIEHPQEVNFGNKSFKNKAKEMQAQAKEIYINDLKTLDDRMRVVIVTIQDYLTGKKKSEMDF